MWKAIFTKYILDALKWFLFLAVGSLVFCAALYFGFPGQSPDFFTLWGFVLAAVYLLFLAFESGAFLVCYIANLVIEEPHNVWVNITDLLTD